ncbi:MAG: hypothetical protein QXN55_06355 [Candidatus Nitrosotenuis sp.]
MISTIILIDNISDLTAIPSQLLKDSNVKNFSFSLDAHHELELRKIKHEVADNLLSQEERFKIFDKMIEFRSWYSRLPSNGYEFEGVNILEMFDTNEFQSFLMPKLINLVIIDKIIRLENPKKIITTSSLSKLVQPFISNQDIELETFQNKTSSNLFWDKITIKYNIGKIPLAFTISRKNYLRIKNFIETLAGFIYNFWFDFKRSRKKCILFLEFNPESFSDLLLAMKNYDGNTILVNQRRTPIWSKKSLKAIKRSKCKILKLDSVLSRAEKKRIPVLAEPYSKKIEKLWENTEFFNNLFQINGNSFWNAIKDVITQTYSKRLISYMSLILCIKKITQSVDIRCIVSLNEVGETEKAFLRFNKNRIPTILLEHGFIERIDKTKRFDVLSNYDAFNDKTAVWSQAKKDWLIEQYHMDPERIIVTGSPRHDNYFSSRLEKENRKDKTLLLAPNPISDVSGLASTNLKLRVNKIITRVFSLAQKDENVKVIVKLHPIQLKHNEELMSTIKKLDNSVPIYLWSPVIDTINNADAVLVISPEIYGTSTMLLESMILGKPTMNIYFDDNVPEYPHIQNKAVFTITDNDDLETNLRNILFDEKFRYELKINADNYVSKFLSNRGNASENFASILKTY